MSVIYFRTLYSTLEGGEGGEVLVVPRDEIRRVRWQHDVISPNGRSQHDEIAIYLVATPNQNARWVYVVANRPIFAKMVEDLTHHDVDTDVTWVSMSPSHEPLREWERIEGRPSRP